MPIPAPVTMRPCAPLPVHVDRFVGRAAELSAIGETLASGARLVTVIAGAGMGKTRLALEVGRDESASYAGGVAFCELAGAREAGGIASQMARAIGLAGTESIASIGRELARRGRTLVIFDTFEHLLAHAAETVGAWARAAPDARLLVTSRERLRLSGETSFRLGPLATDAPDGPQASDAALLFVERARAQRQSYALTAANAGPAVALVRALEGIPLVIELAAARLDVLSVDQILARLPQGLAALGQGPRDADPRHATLQGAMEWSWQLLSPIEQSALAQSSVFRGGFSLPAAEKVIDLGAYGSALDVLQSLRDKSLLKAVQGDTDDVRFDLFESVRIFALEKLAALGTEAATRDRHARHYLSPVASWPAAEHDNVCAVIDEIVADPAASVDQVREALLALLAVDAIVTGRGPWPTHLARLDRAMGRLDPLSVDSEMMALSARVIGARGRAHRALGLTSKSRVDFECGVELARTCGERRTEAGLAVDLGVLHHQLRGMDAARAHYANALAIYRDLGDRLAQGRCVGNLGAILHDCGSFEQARVHYDEALAIFSALGEKRLWGIFLANVGVLDQEEGDFARARANYDRAGELLRAAGDERLVAIARSNLGNLHHEEGRLDEAYACHIAALALLRKVGDPRSEALCRGRLGAVSAASQRLDEAREWLASAELMSSRESDPVTAGVLAVFRAFVDVTLAARASRADNAYEMASAQKQEARAKIAAAMTSGANGAPSLLDLSDDARLAVRILERSLRRLEQGEAPEATLDADALVLGPGARSFRPPGGTWHDLGDRAATRRILSALADHHRQDARAGLVDHEARAPEGRAGLTLESLWVAGWPGEKAASEAWQNRVYVALSYLRSHGLRRYILRSASGYALDRSVRIQRIVTDARLLRAPAPNESRPG